MENSSKKKGFLGEEYAANFLQAKGYKIVSSNFTIRGGEIDLIAEEGGSEEGGVENKSSLVFVEVKTRTSDRFGEGREAYGFYKRKSIRRAIQKFLEQHGYRPYRQDFIEITLAKTGEVKNIEHFENVESS